MKDCNSFYCSINIKKIWVGDYEKIVDTRIVTISYLFYINNYLLNLLLKLLSFSWKEICLLLSVYIS